MPLKKKNAGTLLFHSQNEKSPRKYALSFGSTVIGRSVYANIRLKGDDSSQPLCCSIDVKDNGVATIESKFDNSLIELNGVKLKKTQLLKHGDKFTVAGKTFEYVNKDSANLEVTADVLKRKSIMPNFKYASRIPIQRSALKKIERSDRRSLSTLRSPRTAIKPRLTCSVQKPKSSYSDWDTALAPNVVPCTSSNRLSHSTGKIRRSGRAMPKNINTSVRKSLFNRSDAQSVQEDYSNDSNSIESDVAGEDEGIQDAVDLAPTQEDDSSDSTIESDVAGEDERIKDAVDLVQLESEPVRRSFRKSSTSHFTTRESLNVSNIPNISSKDLTNSNDHSVRRSARKSLASNADEIQSDQADDVFETLSNTRASLSSSKHNQYEVGDLIDFNSQNIRRSVRTSRKSAANESTPANDTLEILPNARQSLNNFDNVDGNHEKNQSVRRSLRKSDMSEVIELESSQVDDTFENLSNIRISLSDSKSSLSSLQNADLNYEEIQDDEDVIGCSQPVRRSVGKSRPSHANELQSTQSDNTFNISSSTGQLLNSSHNVDRNHEKNQSVRRSVRKSGNVIELDSTQTSNAPVSLSDSKSSLNSSQNADVNDEDLIGCSQPVRRSLRKSRASNANELQQTRADDTFEILSNTPQSTNNSKRFSRSHNVHLSLTNEERERSEDEVEEQMIVNNQSARRSVRKSRSSKVNELDVSQNTTFELDTSTKLQTVEDSNRSRGSRHASVLHSSVITLNDSRQSDFQTPISNSSMVEPRNSLKRRKSKCCSICPPSDVLSSTPLSIKDKSQIETVSSSTTPKRNRSSQISSEVTSSAKPMRSRSSIKPQVPAIARLKYLDGNMKSPPVNARRSRTSVSQSSRASSSSSGSAIKGLKRARETMNGSSLRMNKRPKLDEQSDTSDEEDSVFDNSEQSFESCYEKSFVNQSAVQNSITINIISNKDISIEESNDVQNSSSTSSADSKSKNVSGVNIMFNSESPRNDLTKVSGLKKIFATPKYQKSPLNDISDVKGVKRLLQTPKVVKTPKNDLTRVAGVKNLMQTPKVQKSPENNLSDFRGVKKLLGTPKYQKSPENDLTRVVGIKKMFATPKAQNSPRNDLTDVRGVKKILKTPKVQKSPRNDLTDVRGVKKILKTPKVQNSPRNDLTDVEGVKTILRTPKLLKSPLNDLSNVGGIKRFLRTPRAQNSPLNDLSDVAGLKQMLKTPKPLKTPENDLTRVSGVKRLLKTPRIQASPLNDLTQVSGVKDIFVAADLSHAESPYDVIEVKRSRKLLKAIKSPLNDLSNVTGVKNLFRTPRNQKSPKNDLTAVEDISQLFAEAQKSDDPSQPSEDILNKSEETDIAVEKNSRGRSKKNTSFKEDVLEKADAVDKGANLSEITTQKRGRKAANVASEEENKENVAAEPAPRTARGRKQKVEPASSADISDVQQATRTTRRRLNPVEQELQSSHVEDDDATGSLSKRNARKRGATSDDSVPVVTKRKQGKAADDEVPVNSPAPKRNTRRKAAPTPDISASELEGTVTKSPPTRRNMRRKAATPRDTPTVEETEQEITVKKPPTKKNTRKRAAELVDANADSVASPALKRSTRKKQDVGTEEAQVTIELTKLEETAIEKPPSKKNTRKRAAELTDANTDSVASPALKRSTRKKQEVGTEEAQATIEETEQEENAIAKPPSKKNTRKRAPDANSEPVASPTQKRSTRKKQEIGTEEAQGNERKSATPRDESTIEEIEQKQTAIRKPPAKKNIRKRAAELTDANTDPVASPAQKRSTRQKQKAGTEEANERKAAAPRDESTIEETEQEKTAIKKAPPRKNTRKRAAEPTDSNTDPVASPAQKRSTRKEDVETTKSRRKIKKDVTDDEESQRSERPSKKTNKKVESQVENTPKKRTFAAIEEDQPEHKASGRTLRSTRRTQKTN